MIWPSPQHSNVPGQSRIFIYLGLTAVFLLFSYQLVLNHELLGSVADWASESAFPSLGFDSSDNTADASGIEIADTNENENDKIIAIHGSHSINALFPSSPTSKSINLDIPTSTPSTGVHVAPTQTAVPPREKELVFAAMLKTNMSWVTENLPEWHSNIYRVDASPEQAELTVPANRGNEAMVFLTYIIDRYDSLPDVSIYLHSGRYQWHNDNPLYDSVISVRDLQPTFVRKAGYVNLRCTWAIGCPAELEPARYYRERPDDQDHITAVLFPDSFAQLFPDLEMPELIGVPCCSQFALSREKIHERPLEDYIWVRQWLLNSSLDASITGRIFEYSWHSKFKFTFLSLASASHHVIGLGICEICRRVSSWKLIRANGATVMFGKPTEFCLDPRQCFCNTYGYCDMSDEDLQQQWQWRGQTLPEGWPNVPDAATQAHLSREAEAEAGTEKSTKTSSRKRSLALADEMPDISDASRQALRDAAV
ncbi:hypothetical protein N7481_008290 [Penicillium waksmanii]|uniref:uncharacterized protein n=1 Tax=Penicillium waksmanii TaxID=69791 RepID=UPI002549B21E|nr:uncharacterized protein N7481_008290 [Penicillium waksmanii]KAJ5980992.1 hypothetical protein N7481_008290 [Penicillium waksmanii]